MSKLSTSLIITAVLALFIGISLIFRTILPFEQIFVGDWIKFSSIDAYYHMRLVDNLAHNFPNLTSFDPFFIYPGGINVTGVHFFDWLLAGIIWVIGLGSPTQHTINMVGVYFPAILAALLVIPVYFIGRELFNRWAGIIAAALVAILPGEFMGRSILGFTDHHVAETLFSAVSVLFLILAIKVAGQRKLSFDKLLQRDWKMSIRPLVYSLLAGIFLGIYLITWAGSLLFVFIIALYFIIQFIINHLRRKTSDHLGIVGFILFLVALVIFLPFSPSRDTTIVMVVALFIPPVLTVASRLISSRGLQPVYYPIALVGLGVVFIVILFAAAPNTLDSLWAKFQMVFVPGGPMGATTMEMQPFLSPQGEFSTVVAWGNFTTSFFLIKGWPIPGLGLISFVILIWLFIKHRSDEQHWLLFLIWTLVMLVATLTQRRFAYYLVVNIALLSAYLACQIVWLAGLKKLVTDTQKVTAAPDEASGKSKKKDRRKERQDITAYRVNVALVIVVVFFLLFFWNINKSVEVAKAATFAPSNAWQDSLLWMKKNTPEPFKDPDAYYAFYEIPPPGEGYNYPESAYGVTSWWDYGYWISRTAHRIPNTNPSQPPKPIKKVATFFLSQEVPLNQETREIIGEFNSSYVIIDQDIVTSKFWAIVTWAEQDSDIYNEIYLVPAQESGQYNLVTLYYPEYYRTMCVRLYNFDGEAVDNERPRVITYDEVVDNSGQKFKLITDVKEYSSYQKALDYIQSQEMANQIIVGINPFISPIPLEAVQDYKLIYSSEWCKSFPDIGSIPQVKIFEYVGD